MNKNTLILLLGITLITFKINAMETNSGFSVKQEKDLKSLYEKEGHKNILITLIKLKLIFDEAKKREGVCNEQDEQKQIKILINDMSKKINFLSNLINITPTELEKECLQFLSTDTEVNNSFSNLIH